MKKNLPDIFYGNGKVFSGHRSVAQGFNEFFTEIGPKLAKLIPESKNPFSHFLSHPVENNFIFANMNREIIYEALSSLKSKNSAGSDNISTKLLKLMMPFTIQPIIHLFNLFFKTGYVPDSYKCAKVIPIYKSQEMDKFTNYRPISLLSSFSKLLEKVVANQMFRYLNKYNILYCHQYGFRPKHDTTQPILHFLDRIYNGLNQDSPEYTLTVFLDLKKAFDTVDINILLQKLCHYGFRNVTNIWFTNYLKNRTQYVSVSDQKSDLKEIKCGIPQGSVLGPLLFLLYINDLPQATNFFTSLFADDTGLLLSSSDPNRLMKIANFELEKAKEWFQANKLTLNVSKTKYIVFRNKNMNFKSDMFRLMIGDEVLERIGNNCQEKSFKFVGVQFDEFLTWEHHINHVAKRISSSIFALNQAKKFLPLNIRLTLYNSLVQPFLEYGIAAWGAAKCQYIEKIEKLQKKAVRCISNSRYNSHTEPLFGKLKLLKISDIFDLAIQTIMYKYGNWKLPRSLDNMFEKLA